VEETQGRIPLSVHARGKSSYSSNGEAKKRKEERKGESLTFGGLLEKKGLGQKMPRNPIRGHHLRRKSKGKAVSTKTDKGGRYRSKKKGAQRFLGERGQPEGKHL